MSWLFDPYEIRNRVPQQVRLLGKDLNICCDYCSTYSLFFASCALRKSILVCQWCNLWCMSWENILLTLFFIDCRCMELWTSLGELLSLSAKTPRHFTASSRLFYSYVTSLECFIVSLQDSFYVCWGSKQNQRRAGFRVQNLHHSRDQASSSLRNPKLTTPGTMSGAGMAGESKVLYVCSYTDSSFEIRLMSLLGEKNLLTYVQVYFASELEGGNQSSQHPLGNSCCWTDKVSSSSRSSCYV